MVTILLAGLGLAIGSFLNVLIDRVPDRRTLRGRSQCDRCRRTLAWWELIPVLGALILRFRCRTCAARIPARLFLVEMGGAVTLLAIVNWRGLVGIEAALVMIGIVALGVLAIIDGQRGIVPDQISVPAVVSVSILQLIHQVSLSGWIGVVRVAVAVVLGAGFFLLQRWVSRGRWVGDGDIRVGALLGALFPSIPLLAVAFGATYVIGGTVALVLLLTRRVERGGHVPLVPFLFSGAIIATFWGPVILSWYAR